MDHNGIGALHHGQYIFTNQFHPDLDDYNAKIVEDHFQVDSPSRAAEFTVWRGFFFPNRTACDRCFFYLRDCNCVTGQCSNCKASGVECKVTPRVLPALGSPSHPTQPPRNLPWAPTTLPGHTRYEIFPTGTVVEVPALPPSLEDTLGFPPITDQDVQQFLDDMAYVNPSELSINPEIVDKPADDDDKKPISPLLCGSREPPSAPKTPEYAPMTYKSDSEEDSPSPNPSPVPTPAPTPAPDRSTTQAMDGSLTVRFVNRLKKRCTLCAAHPVGSAVFRDCHWKADPLTGESYGCQRCKTLGLVCCVDGFALAPNPKVTIRTKNTAGKCTPCHHLGAVCDRSYPCQHCVDQNAPDACIRASHRGTIPHGTGLGTELYPYISLMGGGPGGLQDRAHRYPQVYDQPPDFHIQCVNWVNGGPVPMPPGYPQPDPAPPRPRMQLRALTDARMAVIGRVAHSTPAQSPAPQPPHDPLHNSRSLRIPPGDEIRMTGLLGMRVFNVSETTQGPPDVGPKVSLYALNTSSMWEYGTPSNDDVEQKGSHPRPLPPPHPNPSAMPALTRLPVPITIDPSLLNRTLPCGEHSNKELCLRPTPHVCSDLTHNMPLPVCQVHNHYSRQIFEKEITDLAVSMRAYACSSCSASIQNPAHYDRRRLNVWGLATNAFDQQDRGPDRSTSRGAPLFLTGCFCATKLLNQTICAPHRIEHFLDMRYKSLTMRSYVQEKYGAMVCPFCTSRPGADAAGFVDGQGVVDERVAYSCLSCLGIVILDPEMHSAMN